MLLDDPDGELQAWFDRYFELLDFTASRNRAPGDSLIPKSQYGIARGYTVPKWWGPQRPKLNTLYWPTGAQRWACFYGLVYADDAAAIAGAGSLVLRDEESGQGMTVTMTPLPIRPITADVGVSLRLLHLVDDRYRWQFANTGSLSVTTGTSWSSLMSTLAGALSITLSTGTVSSDLEQPDPVELSRPYQPVPAILDAATESVGLRVVAGTDATYTAQDWAAAATAHLVNASVSLVNALSGGGHTNSPVPATVRVAFPKWYDYAADLNGQVHTETIDAEDIDDTLTTFTGEFTIQCTAFADFSSDHDASTPDNDSDLEALATAIATAYYASAAYHYDATIPGIAPWTPTAYDDWIEWRFGMRASNGEYHAETRVKSLDVNWAPEWCYAQFADKWSFHSPIEGTLDGALTPGGSAELSVYLDGSDTGINVTVYDTLLASDKQLATETWVVAVLFDAETIPLKGTYGDGQYWKVIQSGRDDGCPEDYTPP